MKFLFKTACLFFIFSLIITIDTCGQKPPIKFGKIDINDLKKTVYEIDSSAPAIVLCNYGFFYNKEFRLTRILRIKILKKEGLSYGNHVFNIQEKTNIRGKTFNLENGEIVETKLKNESIFKEKVIAGYRRTRVAMPNVKVGSVIDIEFISEGFPLEWTFQDRIPVLHSELLLPDSPYVTFRKNYFGFIPFKINTGIRWVTENVPSFDTEPYMNSYKNYISRIEFDVLRINHPYFQKDYAADWNDVSAYLWDLSYFGDILRSNFSSKGIAKDLNLDEKTVEEKIRIVFEKVKEIKWNGYESLYPENYSVAKAYGEKYGNSADINFALIQLLNACDIEAYPIVMSTRDNGMLSIIKPSINKLNYVIAYVKSDNKNYLLDASEELLPFQLLPMRTLNWQGQAILNKREIESVLVETNKKDKEVVFYNLDLDASDYSLYGTISSKKYDYAAYNYRKNIENFNSVDEYIEKLADKHYGLRIRNSVVNNIDSIYLPVTESLEVQIENQVTVIDDEIYITPILYERIEENPFNTSERKYPIDFGYCNEKSITIMIKLPDNCQVIELPQSINLVMPEDKAYFSYQIKQLGQILQLNCKYGRNKPLFIPDEYPILQQFYSKVIEKMSEPLIIKQN
ncbi:MAG: DUF3857 domain-containing protein [Bacteroidetes bacterium]|nr:DUF3857 domain-containing protein [Bacteroidota bacterium]